jgi:YD repeat-containing protein
MCLGKGPRADQQYHGQSFANLRYDYDAAGRLAWRRFYSSGSVYKQTTYTHDAAGNLTLVNYPSSPNITLAYDAANRLTNMVDAAGTTRFTYTPAGNLFTEDNPWASDTVTHSYHASVPRLRAALTVQQPSGNWAQSYSYDDENRLIEVRAGLYSGYYGWKTEFVYDGLSRVRIRRDYDSWYGNWGWLGETRYLYDGMRVVQERNSSNVATVAYTRGLDLSGTLEGAGGIGGLLSRSHGYSGGTWSTHTFYHADGGGNITMLINSSQTSVAVYRYDPYGRTLS